MGDPRFEILLTEALRRLDMHHKDLDEIRSRASWLISAAAVSTSFLGAGLIRKTTIHIWGAIGIGLFVATLALALWALTGPVNEMPFGFSPRVVESDWIRARGLDEDQIRLNLALKLEAAVERTEQELQLRRQALMIGAVALGCEILAWILDLR